MLTINTNIQGSFYPLFSHILTLPQLSANQIRYTILRGGILSPRSHIYTFLQLSIAPTSSSIFTCYFTCLHAILHDIMAVFLASTSGTLAPHKSDSALSGRCRQLQSEIK